MEKIQQGAEAIIYLNKEKQIVKDRTKKPYRIKILDEKIRKLRTRAEAKNIKKINKIIPSPKILKSDEKTKKIYLEYIEGDKLAEKLNSYENKKQLEICQEIGNSIGKLHNENIIHGDLTTSNMIISKKENTVYIIDFGLSFYSKKYEDKAVDLHLLKQALEAKHYKNWKNLFEKIKEGYKSINKKEAEKVLNQLNKVEKRGRYKH